MPSVSKLLELFIQEKRRAHDFRVIYNGEKAIIERSVFVSSCHKFVLYSVESGTAWDEATEALQTSVENK